MPSIADPERLPVHILTGFLGSGKTTLLRNILQAPDFANAAVLVNEFGEVGLDHLLVERLDDSAVLLSNGCICCTVRDDLKGGLLQLMQRRGRDGVPMFDRVMIETTGLADPVPIVATLTRDPMLRHHMNLGNVIAVVDTVNAVPTLEGFAQNARQIGVADKIVLTKTDLSDEDAVAEVERRVRGVNTDAQMIRAAQGVADLGALFALSDRIDVAVHDMAVEAGRFRAAVAGTRDAHGLPSSLSFWYGAPVEWAAFGLWLSLLVARHGDRLLRIKGLIHVEGSETPVVVHGVQSLLHPAEHLEAWPSEDRRTRVVLIGYDLDRDLISRSLATFMRLGQRQLP